MCLLLDFGAIYSVEPEVIANLSTSRVVYSFTSAANGYPQAGLMQHTNGKLLSHSGAMSSVALFDTVAVADSVSCINNNINLVS